MVTYDNGVLGVLWEFVLNLAKSTGDIWDWLTSPQYIGLKIDFFFIDIGFWFTPMYLTGAVLITLIVFGFIKSYIPVA